MSYYRAYFDSLKVEFFRNLWIIKDADDYDPGWVLLRLTPTVPGGTGYPVVVPLRIGSYGVETVLPFSTMEEMPSDAQVMWDNTGDVQWGFRPGTQLERIFTDIWSGT